MIQEKIMPLQPQDKKKILLGYTLSYYKTSNLILIIASFLIFELAKWKYNADNNIIGFFIWIILIFNFMFLMDYLFHKTQLVLSKGKIILVGEITDIYEGGGEHPGKIVCLGLHKQDITWAEPNFELKIGDCIEMHYILLKKNKKGSLIKIEKI